jgi:thiazole synthase ThiGH ThiG subunit
MKPSENLDTLIIAGQPYQSRLLVGTGKYKDFAETRAAIDASGAQIVTVAIRRTNIGQDPKQPSLLEVLPPAQFTILPNTAGCYTADDAVRTLRLARELLDGHSLVKLEVLGDQKTLFPNMAETLAAAATLVKDGFQVMVYCSDDPIAAKQLEEIGCCAVMPLASLIGSGMGILNPWNLQIIIDNAQGPDHRRCRCRHRVGRRHRDGTRLPGRVDEHCNRDCQKPRHDGIRDEKSGGGRPRSIPGGTHAQKTLHRVAELANRRDHRAGRRWRQSQARTVAAASATLRSHGYHSPAHPEFRAAPGARFQRAATCARNPAAEIRYSLRAGLDRSRSRVRPPRAQNS